MQLEHAVNVAGLISLHPLLLALQQIRAIRGLSCDLLSYLLLLYSFVISHQSNFLIITVCLTAFVRGAVQELASNDISYNV